MVNWEWVTAPINRRELVPSEMLGNYNSGSLWAPHLSYADGLFWLVYTDVKSSTAFKDTLNYVITAPAVTGPWSEPTLVTASGFDPALFHDEDGRHYFLNMLFDWRLENPGFAGTVIQEFDARTRTLVGERKHFYRGTSLSVCEGPQILKKDGYYYLLCAAGGTGYMHAATVARAKSLDGPWEDSPYFPLLTARDDAANPLQKSGHACFVEIGGEWYITHICARPLTERGCCTLGRETALQKIEWTDGWPHLANGTHHPELVIPAPKAAGSTRQNPDHSEHVRFAPDRPLPHTFKTLRTPLVPETDYSLSARPGWLRLYGGQRLSSHHKQTLFARRWQYFTFTAETKIDFAPQNFQQVAGLVLFYDTGNWIYAYVTWDEVQNTRILRCDCKDFSYGSEAVSLPQGEVVLKVRVNRAQAQFFYKADGGWQPLGGPQPADHLSDDYVETRRGRCAFTGAMVGICAQDMDAHRSHADFAYFTYGEER